MNIVIANKYQMLLNSLDIDIIKSINGIFTVEELVAQFSNFYFNKMIIDITALKDYEDINVIQSLSLNFDMQKIILVLNDSERVNSPIFLSQLVSLGIYNFTNNVPFLINNPNSYKDVAQFQNLSGFKESKLNEYIPDNNVGKIARKVIGFYNVTEHAGSTTLVYLAKIHLEKYYKVKAVEIDKDDFEYFGDKDLESISSMDLNNYISLNQDADVILVDLNANLTSACDEVIYLMEPGIIKLNKLIKENNHVFTELKNEKIVLNRSVLTEKDVQDFEKESNSKIFYNLPNVDDKKDNQSIINSFLLALGFSRIGESSGGLFDIFN